MPGPPVKTRGKNDVPYYLYLVVHAYQVRSSTVDSPLNLGPAQLANRNSAWELKFSASAYRANYVSCIIAKAISIHYILQAIHIFSREHYPEDLCLPLCFRSGFHFHGIFGQFFFFPHFFKVQLHFTYGQKKKKVLQISYLF